MSLNDVINCIENAATNFIIRATSSPAEAEKILNIRTTVATYNSPKTIERIAKQKDYLRENSLRYLFVTLERMELTQQIVRDCSSTDAYLDNPAYAARQVSIDTFYNKIIPKFEQVFGNLDQYKMRSCPSCALEPAIN